MLPYLMKRFLSAGGKFKQQKLNSLNDIIDDYDVIINCTGLGSKYLMMDDLVRPVRGQVMRVKAPWIYETILDDSADGNYIIAKLVLWNRKIRRYFIFML